MMCKPFLSHRSFSLGGRGVVGNSEEKGDKKKLRAHTVHGFQQLDIQKGVALKAVARATGNGAYNKEGLGEEIGVEIRDMVGGFARRCNCLMTRNPLIRCNCKRLPRCFSRGPHSGLVLV